MSIFEATKSGDIEQLTALLTKDKKLAAAKGPQDRRPLHVAAERGDVEAVRLLLQHKAKADIRDKEKRTPLELAISNGHGQVARMLIDAGAKLASFQQPKYAPLHGWLQIGNEPAAVLMLKMGADPNHVVTTYGRRQTPLHTLAESTQNALKEDVRVRLTRLLLERGADPNARDEQERTPLHTAAEQGQWQMMQLLLDGGADIEAREQAQGTPLHLAVASADLFAVELLLKRGADAEATASDDKTPLDYARLFWGYRYITEAIARKLELESMPEMTRTQPGEFLCACKKGYVDLARRIIKDDPNVIHTRGSVRLIDSASPLHLAAIYDQPRIAELLLEHGHAVDAVDQWGNTPLIDAAKYGHAEMMRVLIKAGAQVNAKTASQDTALHKATHPRAGAAELVRILLDAGADPTARTHRNVTPLQEAQGYIDHSMFPQQDDLAKVIELLQPPGDATRFRPA